MRVKLEDVCERGTSSLMQKDIVDKNGKYPVYGASGRIGSMETYQQEHQTVAVVKDGAGIGRTMLLPEKSSVIGTMQYLIPKNCIESEYLYYVVKYMHLEKYFSGATIPHIYFRDYKTEEFNLHDKTEQREIVSTLKRIEAIISNRQEQLTKLDELVKARFVEMFGDPVINEAKWPIERLEKHLTIIGGYAFKSDGFKTEGIPVIRIGNINSGHFLPTNMVYWHDDSTLERYKIHPGDLVISLTGTVGKNDYGNVCILGNSYNSYYLNQRNAKLELKATLNSMYLSELLKFPKIKSHLTGISRGIRQANISNKDILSLPISIPPLSLQNQFADFVAEVDKSKVEVQKALDQTQLLFDSLMQQYFG